MDEIHVHKTKKSICAHFAESPCILGSIFPHNLVPLYVRDFLPDDV